MAQNNHVLFSNKCLDGVVLPQIPHSTPVVDKIFIVADHVYNINIWKSHTRTNLVCVDCIVVFNDINILFEDWIYHIDRIFIFWKIYSLNSIKSKTNLSHARKNTEIQKCVIYISTTYMIHNRQTLRQRYQGKEREDKKKEKIRNVKRSYHWHSKT